MKPSRRQPISKQASARNFRNATQHTKRINLTAPMRGGIRL